MKDFDSRFIVPQWPAPANVSAVITTRQGGDSSAPFAAHNLALHVGDDPQLVQAARARLLCDLPKLDSIQWLEQVHGVKVVDAQADGRVRTADACITDKIGLACAVMTADCLPLLICDQSGTQVAAVHAGWRGLAKGIISKAIARFDQPADQLLVYLGPAIGRDHFEVGVEVLEAFYRSAKTVSHIEAVTTAFVPSAARPMKYLADIYALARAELSVLGVTSVYGGDDCTYSNSDAYFSYRRDGATGRMASLIWLS